MHFLLSAAATAALLLSSTAAQTTTDCNPLKGPCGPNQGLNQQYFEVDFVNQGAASLQSFNTTAGTVNFGPKGAEFSINGASSTSTTIQSNFYIFFGRVEVQMLAAPGAGVISSFVLQSSDLDEIDVEFVGSNDSFVQTNFFGKGDQSSYDRGANFPLTGPADQQQYTYAVDWTSDRLEWSIDGNVVRTVPYNDPLAHGGANYPQTPMDIRIGIWAGGDPSNSPGTISWAGGPIDYGAAPYTMYIQKLTVTNYNPASDYTYNGESGNYTDIKINA